MILKIASRIRRYLLQPLLRKIPPGAASVNQKTLMALYVHLCASGAVDSINLQDVGFRNYSQHEEDGILLFIFSLIGTKTKKCIEICAGNGIECNTANLIINHRWIGLLCDGSHQQTEKARNFYSSHPDTRYWPPVIIEKWITRDNVNSLIAENGFEGEVDLLSLDIDGIDYWLWEAINCVSPRVVVLEFNHLWGPDASVSVPYREDFIAEFTEYGSDYAGASLTAFVKLGKRKGYRLVATNAIATNAFFLRNDIECKWLPEIETSQCFDHPRARFGITNRLPKVQNKDWVDV